MTKAKKRKKPARRRLMFRKDDPAHNVQVAVVKWLEANGGDAIVVGGIGLIREGDFKFQVCVGITGTPPVKKVEK